MATDLQAHLQRHRREDPLMVGIATGGIWVAEQLHQLLRLPDKLGRLNITFYRDDFQRIGLHPSVGASLLPVTLENRHIVLVDDVLFTGRTVRAALNVLFDYGRPASVTLAVLAQRDGRELPLHADIVGQKLEVGDGEYVSVTGPDPLAVNVTRKNAP